MKSQLQVFFNVLNKKYIKLGISLILFLFVIHQIDFEAIKSNFKNINLFIILIIPIFTISSVLMDALRKINLFRIFKFQIGFNQVVIVLLKGSFYGFFMPSIVGADAYFVLVFGKKLKSYTKVFSGLFFIKFFGLFIYTLVCLLFLPLIFDKINDKIKFSFLNINQVSIYTLIFLVLIIIIYFIIKKRFYLILQPFILKFKEIKEEILSNHQNILFIIIYTFLFYFNSIIGRVLIGYFLGIQLPFINLLSIILIVNLIIMLPVTISGIGVREISYISILGLFGIRPDVAILMSFFDFLISISGVLIGGVIIFIKNLKFVK